MGCIQAEAGWGFEELDLVEDALAHGSSWVDWLIFKALFQPKPLYSMVKIKLIASMTLINV